MPHCKGATLRAVIRGKVSLRSVIHSDGFSGYDGLIERGYAKRLWVNRLNDGFMRGKALINGIEGFWAIAKTRLARFRGVHNATFYLHLKECEFRYNSRPRGLQRLRRRCGSTWRV